MTLVVLALHSTQGAYSDTLPGMFSERVGLESQ